MKNVSIFVLTVALIAHTAWCVHAATAADNGGKAAEAPAGAAQPATSPVELWPDPAKVTFEKFESPEGKFSVSVPVGWDRIKSYPYKTDDTVSGIMLEGPENMEGAPMNIAALYYAGTGKIKGADEYINKVLANPTRYDVKKPIQFSEVEVAGKKGKAFTFTKFHVVILPFDGPPMEGGVMYDMGGPSKRVTMIVRYVVIPVPPGFYSFSYEAPEDMYKDFTGVFDTVVKSFVCQEK
jgi:hypothetical protein